MALWNQAGKGQLDKEHQFIGWFKSFISFVLKIKMPTLFYFFLRTNLDKTLTDGAPLLTCYYTEECLLMGKYSEFVISLLFPLT